MYGIELPKVADFDYQSSNVCLYLAEIIEDAFRLIYPKKFSAYITDDLHGKKHVWSVLRWSLRISSLTQQFNIEDSFHIDYNNLMAACLLHDIAGLDPDYNMRKLHHEKAGEFILPIMEHLAVHHGNLFDCERVTMISRAHRLRREIPPTSLSEEIIALADGLDEGMSRLYYGNKGIRPFYTPNLPISHRKRVVFNRNSEEDGISREDPRNDALMFMIDSLVRNSLNYNPWKLVVESTNVARLRITDECWQEVASEYFKINLRELYHYLTVENQRELFKYVNDFLLSLSKSEEYRYLQKFSDILKY